MNISLTPDLDQVVSRKISSGLYGTPLEVIREALRLLDQQDADQQAWLAETRAKIAAGLAQLERGEGIPGEQVFDDLRRKSQQRRQELAPSMSGFVLSPLARQDLNDIWDYIAQDDLDAADRLVDEIYDAIALMSTMPSIGHLREDLTDKQLRFWPVQR